MTVKKIRTPNRIVLIKVKGIQKPDSYILPYAFTDYEGYIQSILTTKPPPGASETLIFPSAEILAVHFL